MPLTMIQPVQGVTTGVFGQTSAPWRPDWPHLGWDIAAPLGTDIIAPCSGMVVSFVNNGDFGPYAICVYHEESGLYILLAHGSSSRVSLGQRVSQGELLGAVGHGGLASGDHCHVQVCSTPAFPRDIRYCYDPQSFLGEPEMTPAERAEIDELRRTVALLMQATYGDQGMALMQAATGVPLKLQTDQQNEAIRNRLLEHAGGMNLHGGVYGSQYGP